MSQQVRVGAASTICEDCGTDYETPSAAAYCCRGDE